ncbi:uncharacterized protein LOC133191060 isoform X3 [Saccostrea echinata]|uniref:uncharacterized protein LOC133191060 isoform X3 n=1 Tax=Saccostrea echinata TaxID=191078 RepID=UPI002A80D1A8|nr:uncharacterized protein LOC133191060 isoform X3 [Saccostrea echinata]
MGCRTVKLTLFSCLFCVFVNGISGFTTYRSCLDVRRGSNPPIIQDGEYPILINNKLTTSIYCHGMDTPNPKEYLFLRAGSDKNFASVYTNIGSTSACAYAHPRQLYSGRGRTSYRRVRLNVHTLEVDITDSSSAVKAGPSIINYGTAGDKFAYSPKCTPMGTFKIDLTGSPFVVSGDVQWTWVGKFLSSTTQNGSALITNTSYIGCFMDMDERLLPSAHFSGDYVTVEYCIQFCNSRGFPFAGMQNASYCYCGESHDRYPRANSEAECNSPCAGRVTEKCGGKGRISVYDTGVPQAIEGRCGGYPGNCFPALKSAPSVPKLQLSLIRTQPCLQPLSPCKNEGACVAVGGRGYRCQCYQGYTGYNCELQNETVVFAAVGCPAGYQAEKCLCRDNNCAGARFNGDICQTQQGSPKVTCRPSSSAHVILFNVDGNQGQQSISCPVGADLVGCSYWDKSGQKISNGEADRARYLSGQCALLHSCQQCTLQARCKKYDCGCKNGGHCHRITGECVCTDGYSGEKCEVFDYCSFYENERNTPACGSAGFCSAVPENTIHVYGGDQRGDHCVFPFSVNGQSYAKCVEDNTSDPPFACGAVFDGSRDGYIDLGPWSPGPRYTIAAWVRPAVADGTRRTVIGGVASCKDFGIYHFENFWMYYKGKNWTCTKGLDTFVRIRVGQWYLVAVSNNGTHVTGYTNNHSTTVEVRPYSLPTTMGFWIGGEDCCPQGRFQGMIKSVKIWKRALQYQEINRSMRLQGTQHSTVEAMTGGLVGHYELGEDIKPYCLGIDHGGGDWTPQDQESISGTHCNISLFYIPAKTEVIVTPYKTATKLGGTLIIEARNIRIEGLLSGKGSGYHGGRVDRASCQGGKQGQSINGQGVVGIHSNMGGGGGGAAGGQRSDGRGQPGGGGGFGTAGGEPAKLGGDMSGLGEGGKVYGDGTMTKLYMGSGGGAGGCAKDVTINPPGGHGGDGGGGIRLVAEMNVQITGTLDVEGSPGEGDIVNSLSCVGTCPASCSSQKVQDCHGNNTKACWDDSGPGGGGSGGSIHIIGKVVSLAPNSVLAMGGAGGFGTRQACGGQGGMGRIRVEAEILKGGVPHSAGVVTTIRRKRQFVDHSLPGRSKINLQTTKYGDEVYRGCFEDTSSSHLFSVLASTPGTQQMSPDWCIHLCRQQGYRYSGTKPPNICYCDNHLNMNKKKDDSQCNSPCAGNSMMTCGGTDRIQVFGPPPGTPAIVHPGVQQKCEPWCQTSTGSSPSWGQCNPHDTTATTYKILCQCPPGRQGVQCSQSCDPGSYGNSCQQNCTCNMTNTATCNPITGSCQCKPGYQGNQCQDVCPKGRFGTNCQGVCNCTRHSDCDPVSGVCLCKPGFTGAMCNFPCPQGFFGRNCSEHCRCTEHGNCDPVQGVCHCQPGWTAELCGEQCSPYTFGVDCTLSCDCNGSPCNSVTGQCECKPGRTGSKCQKDCPYQMYGDGCRQSCPCPQGCDPVSGNCVCPPGNFGAHCEFFCSSGSYGKNCQSRCQCYMNQTSTCDVAYGFCTCKDGFVGPRCEHSCPVGFYGPGCTKTCPQCQHSAPCDATSGLCICPPGWSGQNCEIPCGSDYYGNNCTQHCPTCNPGICSPATGLCICQDKNGPCKCPTGYYGDSCQNRCQCIHGNCGSTGNCVCDKGWKGTRCDSPCVNIDTPALVGVTLSTLSCKPACSYCYHGRCHFNNDICLCDAGFFGLDCNQKCQKLTYGPGCIYRCDQCVHSDTCDPISGQCQCLPGYQGVFCQQPCSKGSYGNGCKQNCSCQNGGECDNVNGTCLCPTGFMGSDCSQRCPKGKYGPDCSLNCTCGPLSEGCDVTTGKCNCQPGFTGDKCEKSCPTLAYGAGCERSCRDVCDVTGMLTCSPVDGACQCRPGYTGQKCDQYCPSGMWGVSCAQRCLCGSHGNCDRETGVCDCDPGYNGTYCNQVCDAGSWGKHCSNACNCGGANCNPVIGECLCPPGKIGHHCEQECGASYFGFQCAQLCGCQNNGVCDKVTGECTCQPGWSGTFCDQRCPDGMYGADCSNQCPNCRNGGSCDSITGLCLCAVGYKGVLCNQTCDPGTWGANCQSYCPSPCKLNCVPTTGECPCHQGACLNGGICKQGKCVCQYGFFGDDCSQSLGRTLASQKSNSSPSSLTLTSGQVVGIVMGLLVLILLVVLLTIFIMRRRYRNQQNNITSMNLNNSLQEDSDVRGFTNPHYDVQHSDNMADSSGGKSETHSENSATA